MQAAAADHPGTDSPPPAAQPPPKTPHDREKKTHDNWFCNMVIGDILVFAIQVVKIILKGLSSIL